MSLWSQSQRGWSRAGRKVTDALIDQSPFQKLQVLRPLWAVQMALFYPIHPGVLPICFLKD